MPAAVTTTVSELADSRVQVQVEVPAPEVESALHKRARQLGRDLRLPGFRRGHVPPQLVLQRLGRETVLDDAVRDGLAGWYAQAVGESGIVPVGDPQLTLGELPGPGLPFGFTIEIGVLPRAALGAYRGVEAPRREPHADPEALEAELQQLRERLARLETVERAAEHEDYVVIDYIGSLPEGEAEDAESWKPFPGGEGRDQLVELGGGNLIPGFEEGLLGAAAGDSRTLRLTFPDEYGAEELAGREASFEVTVKEVKRKVLPELDDDLAVDAGFDDLEQLRADVAERLLAADRERAEGEFRQAALDAAVDASQVPVTPELVKARAREMWERSLHSLSHRGISREAYLRILGRPEEELLAELEPDAERALRREAVITAIVAAENIVPGEDALLEAVTPTAEREGVEPATLLEDLRGAGRLEDLREDLAARTAIDLVAEAAKPIEPARAQAREQLWTPEKGAEQEAPAEQVAAAPGRLWTPDR